MAFTAGKTAVFYANGYNLTGYFSSVSLPGSADTGETTVMGLDDKTYLALQKDGTWSAEGYYDGSANAVDAVLSAALGVDASEITYLPYGDTNGYAGYCAVGIKTKYDIETPVDGVAAVSAEGQMSGGRERVTVLHALSSEASTGDGTQHDNLASSANGGSAYIQCTASGTPTTLDVIVEHSATGAWAGEEATIATFTQITTHPASERIPIAGTINQYTRAAFTIVGGDFTFGVYLHRA